MGRPPLTDDDLNPSYCTDCRKRIPRAESMANGGRCVACAAPAPSPPPVVAVLPPRTPRPPWANRFSQGLGQDVGLAVGCLVAAVFGLGALALLASLGAQRNARESALRDAGARHLRNGALVLLVYAADHDGRLPPRLRSLGELAPSLSEYVRDPNDLRSHNPNGGQILANDLLAARQPDRFLDPGRVLLLHDERLWPRTRLSLLLATAEATAVFVAEGEFRNRFVLDPSDRTP
ncbi:MAG: hypothetical protein KIS66_13875 [Fimbriimonadaceae bacterium]|nr:hypothetical protein [Fimbriimonadaceae bacterium]